MILASYLSGILIIIGSVFAVVAALGLLRLPDVYSRMHAATKAGALGSGLMMIALALVANDFATVTRALAGVVFFLLDGAHLKPFAGARGLLGRLPSGAGFGN